MIKRRLFRDGPATLSVRTCIRRCSGRTCVTSLRPVPALWAELPTRLRAFFSRVKEGRTHRISLECWLRPPAPVLSTLHIGRAPLRRHSMISVRRLAATRGSTCSTSLRPASGRWSGASPRSSCLGSKGVSATTGPESASPPSRRDSCLLRGETAGGHGTLGKADAEHV